MKHRCSIVWSLVAVLLASQAEVLGQAPLGTEFAYQGQLKEAGVPVDGSADFEFTLWDAESGGDQIGWPVSLRQVDVVNGLFTVQLDFGGSAFEGDARWLEITVTYPSGSGIPTTLSPRQPLTAAPYALYALSGPGSGGLWAANGDDIYNTNSGNVGIGISDPSHRLHVESAGAEAVFGENTASGGVGLRGLSSDFEGGGFGVRGDSYGTTGIGVFGIAAMTTGINCGVYGQSQSQTGRGVYGLANNAAGANYGVYGKTNSPGGWAGYFEGRGYFSGNVGIGTTTPQARVHAHGTGSDAGVYGISELGEAGRFEITNAANDEAAVYAETNGTGSASQFVYDNTGSPGTGVLATSNGPTGSAAVSGLATGAAHAVTGTAVGTGRAGLFQIINASSNTTALYCATTGTGLAFEANGTARVQVLEITGADLAEKFPVSEEVKPGMVLAIDPEHPGKLCLARAAYNRRVAGVVSGAGDLPMGAVLGLLPGHEEATPIALTGRVYVWADASNGPIEPGDMLTTSDTPGHAMKATDRARSYGATIGKAMSALESGHGLVLVLVNLQ